MKKIICVLLALTALISLTACSGGTKSGKDVDLGALKDKMISELSIENANSIDADALMGLYGISADDIEQSACFTTMSGAFPDEVVMIKTKDADAFDIVYEKLSARVDEVKVQSQNYDAENYALAQKCEIVSSGNYVAMFLSPDYDEMVKLFNEAIGN